MNPEVLYFAAGIAVGALVVLIALLPVVLKGHKYLAYRNPADMLFYEFEMARLKKENRPKFKFPLPFLSKKPKVEPVSAPGGAKGVEADQKAAFASAVESVEDAREYASKVEKQRRQLLQQRQGVIPT